MLSENPCVARKIPLILLFLPQISPLTIYTKPHKHSRLCADFPLLLPLGVVLCKNSFPKMASTFTAATVAIPTFTGLKVESAKPASPSHAPMIPSRVFSGARASMSTSKVDMRRALVAATASVGVLMGAAAGNANANAIEVLMGSNGGELAFIPKEFQIAPGEPIIFKNNAGFPHNVIFDEDEVPPGVDVGTISMPEEDLLNAPGETYTVKLDKKGAYKFYCGPHQGSGMTGKVIVN